MIASDPTGPAAPRSRLSSWLRSEMAARCAAIALGLVFVAAAIPKIADPPGFAHEVSNYALLPTSVTHTTALGLPWVEIFCGLALILGPARRGAAALAGVLLLVFVAGLSLNLVRGRPVDCGCFSTAESVRTPEQRLASMRLAILRDAVFLVLAFGSLRSSAAPPWRGRAS